MGILKDAIDKWTDRTAAYKDLTRVISGLTGSNKMIGQFMGRKEISDKNEALNLYSSWVYTAANRNANAVASAKLNLYATRSTGELRAGRKYGHSIGKTVDAETFKRLKASNSMNDRLAGADEVEHIIDHPYLDMMQNVNPHKNAFETMQALSLNIDLGGDNYWYIDRSGLNGTPIEFWTLRQDYVTVVPDSKDFIKGYLFGRPGATQKIAFEPDEIIQFQRVNLLNPWYGMGRVAGAQNAILGYRSMEDYEASVTRNNAIPAAVIQYKGGKLDSKRRKELLSEWNNALRGNGRSGSSFVADMDFDVKTLAMNPRDLSFLQGRKWRFDEIITAFGQTGAMYDEKANRANIEGAIHLWEKWEITPTLQLIEQKINEKLVPMYGEPRLFVAYDPIIQRDRAEVRDDEKLYLENGMPINRVLMRNGLEPVEGGDIGYISNSKIPIGSAVVSEPATVKQANTIKQNLQSKKTAHSPIRDSYRKNVSRMYLKADPGGLSGGANKPLSKPEKSINDGIKTVFTDQEPLAIAAAASAVGADFQFLLGEEWTFRTANAIRPGVTASAVAGAKRGAQQVGVVVTDFIDRPTVQNVLKNSTLDFALAINAGTEQALREAIAAGLEAGESIPELKKRIELLYDGWKDWRAERIARTESIRALELGRIQQWKETGVVAGKIWDANGDACPFCLDMDGKYVELGEPYFTPDGPDQVVEFNGKEITLQHNYMTVDAPPLHPNCRCSVQPVLIES